MPLAGKRVLVTRPALRAAEFVEGLRAAGAQPILAPTIRFEPPDDPDAAADAAQNAARYAWVVFTSATGVHAFFDFVGKKQKRKEIFGTAKLAAIGLKTARALLEHDLFAHLVPTPYVAEELATRLIEASLPGEHILIFRAQEGRDVLPEMLRAAGREANVVAGYKTCFTQDEHFESKVAQCDVLTFTSASTVRGFVENIGGAQAALAAADGKVIACVGPIAAAEAQRRGLRVDIVADESTSESLLSALAEHLT